MDINKLTYGEMKEIAAIFNQPKEQQKLNVADGETVIIVADGGWNYVGEIHQNGMVTDRKSVV